MFEEGKSSSCLQSFYEQSPCAEIIMPKDFQLLAVTDAASCPRSLVEQVERIAVCPYKPHKLLLRAKDLDTEAYAHLAKNVQTICQKHDIELIIHTHWQLALELGISRVHLPLPLLAQTPLEARQRLYLSSSVHSVEEAQKALAEGAQALIAGHIYPTDCKAGVPPKGLEFLQQIYNVAVKHTTPTNPTIAEHFIPTLPKANKKAHAHDRILCQNPFPVYAIGGIGFDPSQWQELAQHGATGACIMSAYMHI